MVGPAQASQIEAHTDYLMELNSCHKDLRSSEPHANLSANPQGHYTSANWRLFGCITHSEPLSLRMDPRQESTTFCDTICELPMELVRLTSIDNFDESRHDRDVTPYIRLGNRHREQSTVHLTSVRILAKRIIGATNRVK